MDAIVKIVTKENTITVTAPINFDPVELPYGAVGYDFNGSSKSSLENLNRYWRFVDDVFKQSNISTDEYVTLKSVEINGNTYGVLD